MRLIRTLLSILLVTTTLSVAAQELVVVKGKKCLIHTVSESDTLYSLAKHYDVSLRDLEELNGAIDASSLAVGSKLYIPYNAKAHKRKSSESVAVEEVALPEFIEHEVVDGDTLYSLARFYKVDLDELIADNAGVDHKSLEVGSSIKIRKEHVGSQSLKDIDKDIKRHEREMVHEYKNTEPKRHTVQAGETLFSLARKYRTTEKRLMELNGFNSPDDMLAGMTIIVRGEVDGDVKSPGGEQIGEQTGEQTGEQMAQLDSVADLSLDIVADTLAIGRDSLVDPYTLEIDSLEMAQNIRIPEFRRVAEGDTLKVALLLPMHINGKVAKAFVDYYRGTLLALEDLKRQGYSVDLSVMDTERSAIKLSEIVQSEAFTEADLILGPIYAEELNVVLPYAEEHNIPVVTPLSDINPESISSPVLFQMQADSKYKYEKYAHILDGSYEINIVYAPSNNEEYLAEIEGIISGLTVRRLNMNIDTHGAVFRLRNADGTDGAPVSVESLVQSAKRKAIIIVANRDFHIEKALLAIGEAMEKVPEGADNECYVIGDREWDALPYIDRTGYFTSRVSLITPYNSKSIDNDAIKVFESRFLAMYGILPTPYACRGYDAAMMFCTKLFAGLDKYILLEELTPLSTTYKFKFEDGMFVNSEWVNIHYQSNFTVAYE